MEDKRTVEQKRGQHGSCETVKVKADNEQGHVVINAHDFNDKEHELFEEPKSGPDYDSMTAAQLKRELKALGRSFDAKADKEALLALLKGE
jgi:hypothetical protein